jgi:hypothetical protein
MTALQIMAFGITKWKCNTQNNGTHYNGLYCNIKIVILLSVQFSKCYDKCGYAVL